MRKLRRKREILFTNDVQIRSASAKNTSEGIHMRDQIIAFFLTCFFLTLTLAGVVRMYQDLFALEGEAIVCIAVGAITIIILALFYRLVPEKKWVFVGIVLVLLFITISNREMLAVGFANVINEWINKINPYYSIHIANIGGANLEDVGRQTAYLLITVCLALAMTSLCIWKKKRIGVILPGVVFIVMELLVGYAPGSLGLLLFLAGVAGMLPVLSEKGDRGWQEDHLLAHRIGMCLCALIVVMGVGLKVVGEDQVTKVIGKQKSVLAYQRYYERLAMDWKAFAFLGGESGKVTNNTPLYTERDVLQISMDSFPNDNIYLRGYVGDTYQNGDWKNTSEKKFEEESAKWNLTSVEEPGALIQNMFYESMLQNSSVKQTTYTISYLATGNHYAYLPYLTDLTSVTEDVNVDADGVIERTTVLDQSVDGLTHLSIFNLVDDDSNQEQKNELEQNYESYLAMYLQVPDGLEQLDGLAEELKQTMNLLEEKGASQRNKELAAICLVRKAVNDRVTYSMDLEELPVGADVVENFLFTSGEGYCTHYASAGTLLFRELGIPARYVTGYVVKSSEMKSQNNGNFSATIKDSSEHAWVEIYLEGVGWYPVEMINGFDELLDSMVLYRNDAGDVAIRYEDDRIILLRLTGEDEDVSIEDWTDVVADQNANQEAELSEESEETETDANQTIGETEQPSTIVDAQANETENQDTQNADLTDTEQVNTTEQMGNTSGSIIDGSTGAGASEGSRTDVWNAEQIGVILARILAVCFGIVIVVAAFFAGRRWKEIRLERSFRQTDRRKAIHCISSQIEVLMRRNRLLRKNAEDVDFFRAFGQMSCLSKDEVVMFQQILERNAFSQEEMTKEDAKFCYLLYRRIKKEEGNRNKRRTL